MLAYVLSLFNLTMVANKQIMSLAAARWDAYTRGGFAIMPHMYAPVIGKLNPYSASSLFNAFL